MNASVYHLHDNLVQIIVNTDSPDFMATFSTLHDIFHCSENGQQPYAGTAIGSSIIVQREAYDNQQEEIQERLPDVVLTENTDGKVRAMVMLDDGIVSNVYANNPNCQIVVVELDDNNDDPLTIHNFDHPDVTFPFHPIYESGGGQDNYSKLIERTHNELKEMNL